MRLIKRSISCTVLQEDNGKAVQKVLKLRLHASTALISHAKTLEQGILLNGVRAFTTAKVRTGDVLQLQVEDGEKSSPNIVPIEGKIDIVYEDADFLIINKAAGTPVHSSQGHFEDSLANHVAYYMQQKGDNFVFRAINRLDKNTSGLMAVAKSSHIHARMMAQLHSSECYREYRAIVCGVPPQKQGEINAPIARECELSLRRVVRDDGKHAITHYEIIEIFERECTQYSLAKIHLETGRTHQIRVHFAHIGCPVAGDFLYGKENVALPQGHALHSNLLRFRHPITLEIMQFETQLPKEMQEFMHKKDL